MIKSAISIKINELYIININTILFKSSVLSLYIHIIALTYYDNVTNKYLLFVLYSGLFGSIVNHYFTNEYILYTDRILMIIGFHYDFYILFINRELLHLVLLISTIILYVVSKIIKSTFPHMLSHLVLIVVHTRTIILFSTNRI